MTSQLNLPSQHFLKLFAPMAIQSVRSEIQIKQMRYAWMIAGCWFERSDRSLWNLNSKHFATSPSKFPSFAGHGCRRSWSGDSAASRTRLTARGSGRSEFGRALARQSRSHHPEDIRGVGLLRHRHARPDPSGARRRPTKAGVA